MGGLVRAGQASASLNPQDCGRPVSRPALGRRLVCGLDSWPQPAFVARTRGLGADPYRSGVFSLLALATMLAGFQVPLSIANHSHHDCAPACAYVAFKMENLLPSAQQQLALGDGRRQ